MECIEKLNRDRMMIFNNCSTNNCSINITNTDIKYIKKVPPRTRQNIIPNMDFVSK